VSSPLWAERPPFSNAQQDDNRAALIDVSDAAITLAEFSEISAIDRLQ
jgi:hypothetical protein